jgi:FtsP/CotA-like multicopper oxidase with cupredoxin domain
MAFTRRHFIGAAAAFAAVPRLSLAQTAADGFIEVRAAKVSLGLLEDGEGKTAAWMLGSGPDPAVIRAKQGAELKLRFINELDAEIWLHFFGVRGPSELMTINVPPGADQAFDCVFTPPDAGTFWIGPMADVSRARDMGLIAVLVVEEAQPLPGLAEMVLVLDDWKIDAEGSVEGDFGNVEAMVGEGRLGNWFTVNNRFRPQLALKPSQFTRLRLLNVANVRAMGVLFKGQDPLLIARDGQPVSPAPLDQKALLLAPGQRADLLVSAEEGDIRMALDLFEDVVEIAYLTAESRGTPPAIDDNFALPDNPLTELPGLAEASAFRILIEGGIKGGLKSAKLMGEERDLRTLLENGKGWALNGVAGPSPEPMFSAPKGETMLLEIDNRTAFSQALHIHGHVWQEIGEVPSGVWQDTAVVPPGEVTTLALVADNPGTWAIHSLIAERADGGMIGSFRVLDAAAEPATEP